MRVILDTNVLLSGLLSSQGAPGKLLDAWEQKLFTLVACEALIAELREVTARPFFRVRLRPSVVALLIAGLRDFSLFCQGVPSGPIAPDPKDSYLLALAEASTADFLVTGDKELLSLKHHKSARIISPSAILRLLKKTEEGYDQGQVRH